MANLKLTMTVPVTSSTPNGRISFIRYNPQNVSVKRPLIIYLHGANCRSLTQTTSTLAVLEDSNSGVPYYTNSAHPTTGGILPSYPDPSGQMHEFYVLAPQLYGTPNTGNQLWNNTDINHMFDYAENPANNMNIDWTRVYFFGYSLGGGGTLTALGYVENARRIAAAVIVAPGYMLNTPGSYVTVAQSGVPILWAHSCGDSITNGSSNGSETWMAGIRRNRPLVDPRYYRWYNNSHNVQHRLFTTVTGGDYPLADAAGNTSVVNEITERHKMVITSYQWCLQYKKERIDPKYITIS